MRRGQNKICFAKEQRYVEEKDTQQGMKYKKNSVELIIIYSIALRSEIYTCNIVSTTTKIYKFIWEKKLNERARKKK